MYHTGFCTRNKAGCNHPRYKKYMRRSACRNTCGACGEASSGDKKLVEVEHLMSKELFQESRKDEKHHKETKHKIRKDEENVDDFVDAFLDASGYLYQFSDSFCSKIGNKMCFFFNFSTTI